MGCFCALYSTHVSGGVSDDEEPWNPWFMNSQIILHCTIHVLAQSTYIHIYMQLYVGHMIHTRISSNWNILTIASRLVILIAPRFTSATNNGKQRGFVRRRCGNLHMPVDAPASYLPIPWSRHRRCHLDSFNWRRPLWIKLWWWWGSLA